jgi:hypothetical protein
MGMVVLECGVCELMDFLPDARLFAPLVRDAPVLSVPALRHHTGQTTP